MLTALEFINVEQLHKKNSALLALDLSSAICDHILNKIGITPDADNDLLTRQLLFCKDKISAVQRIFSRLESVRKKALSCA